MSESVCSPCVCPTPTVVNVPGTAGTDGTNGVNAFSTTIFDFTVCNVGQSISINLVNNNWITIGQNIFINDAGMFQVIALGVNGAVGITYLNYTSNTHAGNFIPAGSHVSPGATEPVIANPLPVADGGTGAASAGAARTSLGAAASGANSDITSLTGLSTPLSVAYGGTGATTVAAALAALGLPVQFVTGTFVCNGVTPVTVANAVVTANSVVVCCLKTVGGTVGAVPAVKTITPGVGFTIAGTASDTSTYNFIIIN